MLKTSYSAEDLAQIAQTVDQVISLDVSNRKTIAMLYDGVRKRTGEPLCMLAARRIFDRVSARDVVMLTPGSLIYPFMNLTETDGPLGAAALARVLVLGLGARALFVVNQEQVDVMAATCRAGGINLTDPERLVAVERSAAIVTFPVDISEAKIVARDLFARFSPKAVIGIERRGRNENGVYHALPKGRNMNNVEAKLVELFDVARREGVLTIGVGDGANEIGWGVIADLIREKFPFGDKCSCGCGGGVGDTTQVDVMVAASVSNWGAYGIETCLAVLLDRPELVHDNETETRMLTKCVDAGGIDGVTHLPELGVDGMHLNTSISILTLLRETSKVKFVYPDYASQ